MLQQEVSQNSHAMWKKADKKRYAIQASPFRENFNKCKCLSDRIQANGCLKLRKCKMEREFTGTVKTLLGVVMYLLSWFCFGVQAYPRPKLNKSYNLNMCSLLYIKYTLGKLEENFQENESTGASKEKFSQLIL